jgi:DNA replication protein DnaC
VARRYEKFSTVFKSNKAYSEWGEILGDNVIASAISDRILYHGIALNIHGESYRMKARKAAETAFPPPAKAEGR